MNEPTTSNVESAPAVAVQRVVSLPTFGEYLKANIEVGIIDFVMRGKINEEGDVEFYIHPASVSGDTQDYLVGTKGKDATHIENLELVNRLLDAVGFGQANDAAHRQPPTTQPD